MVTDGNELFFCRLEPCPRWSSHLSRETPRTIDGLPFWTDPFGVRGMIETEECKHVWFRIRAAGFGDRRRYARSDVIGDNFYEGRVVGFEESSREISVLTRDYPVDPLRLSYRHLPRRTKSSLIAPAASDSHVRPSGT